MREVFCFVPRELLALAGLKRCHDMQAFAYRRFAEGHKTDLFQALLHFLRSLDNTGKVDVGVRVKVEHEAARHLRLMGLAIPGMKFDGA